MDLPHRNMILFSRRLVCIVGSAAGEIPTCFGEQTESLTTWIDITHTVSGGIPNVLRLVDQSSRISHLNDDGD